MQTNSLRRASRLLGLALAAWAFVVLASPTEAEAQIRGRNGVVVSGGYVELDMTLADNALIVGTSASATTAAVLPNCPTGALSYTAASHSFTCTSLASSSQPNYVTTSTVIPAGSTTHYFDMAGYVNTAEASSPSQAGTVGNLRCRATATTGGTGVTVTFESATCGSLAWGASLPAVTVTNTTIVADDTNTDAATVGECAGFEAEPSTTTTAVGLICSYSIS